MKCPFCHQELDTSSYYVRCHNPNCNTTVEMEGTEELWEELIRTNKALGKAKQDLEITRKALKEIDWCAQDYAKAQETLDKITALEQKE